MKVLHLFSNAKWTGPAEPALNLCVTLRRLGVDAEFACAPDAGESVNKVVETARDRGLTPILKFRLNKHRNPLWDALDRRALRKYLKKNPCDLVHCHLDNDHRIAGPVAKALGIPVVRSSYYGDGVPADMTTLLSETARIIEPSELALLQDAKTHGMPRCRMTVVPGAVDVKRFDPARQVPDGRRWLNIPPDAFVVGIVARMQTHRRYEDFFQAIRRLADEHDKVHVIVVGRGTHQEEVGKQPVRDLLLTDHVHFPGYLSGENYVGMLKAFDVKAFLVPGSDGTCRAVREAMAMGKPAVVADRGMLAEIVTDGEDGFVCDGSAEGLYEALSRFTGERGFTHTLGQAARKTAVTRFSLEAQATAVKHVYDEVLAQQ